MSSGTLRSKLTTATTYGKNLEKILETHNPATLPKNNPYSKYATQLADQTTHSKANIKTILESKKTAIPPNQPKTAQSIKATRFVKNKKGGKTNRRRKSKRTTQKKHSTRKHK